MAGNEGELLRLLEELATAAEAEGLGDELKFRVDERQGVIVVDASRSEAGDEDADVDRID